VGRHLALHRRLPSLPSAAADDSIEEGPRGGLGHEMRSAGRTKQGQYFFGARGTQTSGQSPDGPSVVVGALALTTEPRLHPSEQPGTDHRSLDLA
jgi:hypothetical protein